MSQIWKFRGLNIKFGAKYGRIDSTELIQVERHSHWSPILNIRGAKNFQLRPSRPPPPLPLVRQFRRALLLDDDCLSTRSNYTPDIVVYQVRICQHISNGTGTKYVHARKLGALSHNLLNRIQ